MSEVFQASSVQNKIGYTFRDTELLKTAFTHSSSAVNGTLSNEGLIFLGSAVTELLIRDHLYSNFSQAEIKEFEGNTSGEPSFKHTSLINKCADGLGLSEYMTISASASAIKNSPTTENELFLALTAAIYKDGGMAATRAFIIPKLRAAIAENAPSLSQSEIRRPVKKAPEPETHNKYEAASADNTVSERRIPKSPSKAADTIKNIIGSKLRRGTAERSELESPKRKRRSLEASESSSKDTSASGVQAMQEKDTSSSARSKRFISDALTPRAPLNSKKSTQNSSEPVSNVDTSENNENYKSALQEYIQKSIRSSTVMLEYKDKKCANGTISVEISLYGKTIAEERAHSKKEASQKAARSALKAITSTDTDAYAWFSKLPNSTELPINGAHSEQTDYVSRLNQTFQKRTHSSNAQIKYEKLPSASAKMFSVAVIVNGKELGRGEGKTIKEARQNAAKAALDGMSEPA